MACGWHLSLETDPLVSVSALGPGALVSSSADNLANEDNVKYYVQRAKNGGAGLIFAEGIMISPQGTEWPNAPGIWDEAQSDAWKKVRPDTPRCIADVKVVDAVHAEGTPIIAQLWHVGGIARPDMPLHQSIGGVVLSPSGVAHRGGKVSQIHYKMSRIERTVP